MRIAAINEALIQRVQEAMTRLTQTRTMDGHVVVDLPIMYPSGAMVVVQIEQNRDKVLVSDMGHGLVEAEMSAADGYYGKAATKAADDFGVQFDGYAMFALWVPIDRVEAAIVCVGNASSRAAGDAIRKAAEAHSRNGNERIFDRISSVFGKKRVSKTAEIPGRHASWDAHNVIVFPNKRRAVFEYMSSHPVSISSKFAMFSDIGSAEDGIALNAVVQSLDKLDAKAQLVGDVANIVSVRATDEQYRRYAEAS